MQKIALILTGVLLNACAQLSIKKGMTLVGEISAAFTSFANAFPSMIINVYLWLGLLCYGVSVLLWMVVLSKVDVSFAYPFLSIGYVLSAIVGYFFFHESVTPVRIAGIIVICIGVILISRS